MFNMLGDRDYDFFNENEHDYLKKKIGYAYFWTAEEYSDQENKTIEKTYQKICDEAGEYVQCYFYYYASLDGPKTYKAVLIVLMLDFLLNFDSSLSHALVSQLINYVTHVINV